MAVPDLEVVIQHVKETLEKEVFVHRYDPTGGCYSPVDINMAISHYHLGKRLEKFSSGGTPGPYLLVPIRYGHCSFGRDEDYYGVPFRNFLEGRPDGILVQKEVAEFYGINNLTPTQKESFKIILQE